MKYKNAIFGCAILCTHIFHAQEANLKELQNLDEVVVIDSKFDLKRENSGKVISKITAEELERSKGQSLPQVINRLSGMEISGSRGYAGQNLGYYIRSGRNRQVVIMLNGIQLNDPSSIANDFDLRLIPVSQVESIEVIKGASSTLYGSGAGAAVINIITKDPADEKLQIHLRSSAGTNQSQENQDYNLAKFQNAISASGNIEKWQYLANFSHFYSDNLSAINSAGNKKDEEDPFRKYNLRGQIGYEFSENVNLQVFGNYNEFSSDFDNYNFTDNKNVLHSNQFQIGSKTEFLYESGSLTFNNSYSKLFRKIEAEFPNKFDSNLLSFDLFNKYTFGKIHSVLGLNGSFSRFNSYEVPFGETEMQQRVSAEIANFQIIDPYANFVYVSDFGFNLNTGARLNIHSSYGTNLVYNFNPSYNFKFEEKNLKILGSYSTAYITPSLYQLYDVAYGNPDLEPEKNRTIEGGLEFHSGKIRASAVYFTRKEKDFIDFVLTDPENFSYSFKNIDEEFTAEGVELEFSAELLPELSFLANYTFTEAEERFALRLPKHKANAALNFDFNKFSGSLKYQFNGDRTDSFYNETSFANENVILESFELLDFYLNYKWNENFAIFGSITNITNEEYRELYGYTSLGRNVELGFSLSL